MRKLVIAAAVGMLTVALAPSASADVKPAGKVCAKDDYACMQVSPRQAGVNETVIFTGKLSPRAQRNVRSWTAGEMNVCLTRYRTKPNRDGSWPSTTLDQACTTVNRDGSFTLNAQLGERGTFFYGLEAGTCRASRAECGNADPGLIGVGSNKRDRALALTTG
jgi:hypothetical protein